MFVFLLFVLPVLLPAMLTVIGDPAPGITQTKAEVRNYECERMSDVDAHERYPGEFSEPAPRGSFIETAAVVCSQRIMQEGERPARDEAILSNLRALTVDIAEVASATVDASKSKTWHVEGFYPDATMATKIAFAAKAELVTRGHRVSDRVPLLAADDVLILGRMQQDVAYPAACQRYFAEGGLPDTDVLLAVILRDARETVLHAGVCERGAFRWIR